MPSVHVFAKQRKNKPICFSVPGCERRRTFATNHVNVKVSQYVILHVTKTALSGSQTPLEASSSTLALEARSIGTSRMMLAGSARERKTGSTRYAGALRRGRKCRIIRRTRIEIHRSAATAKMSEPAADAMRGGLRLVAFRDFCAQFWRLQAEPGDFIVGERDRFSPLARS
jgi:hypothetical protein